MTVRSAHGRGVKGLRVRGEVATCRGGDTGGFVVLFRVPEEVATCREATRGVRCVVLFPFFFKNFMDPNYRFSIVIINFVFLRKNICLNFIRDI